MNPSIRAPHVCFGLVVACLALCTSGWGKEANKGTGPAAGGGQEQMALHQGLIAHYFEDPIEWDGLWKTGQKPGADPKDYTFHKYSYSRGEPHINHVTVQRGWFSVRWVGYLKIPPGNSDGQKTSPPEGGQAGTGGGTGAEGTGQDGGGTGGTAADFTLELWMDDGARLFLDGERLVDDWKPCAEDTPNAHRVVSAHLSAGLHRLVVEYFQGESLPNRDPDPAKFYWTCPALKIPRQIVPASHLFHTVADLQDYVPSQGLSLDDQKRLQGGQTLAQPLAPGARELARVTAADGEKPAPAASGKARHAKGKE